MFSSLLISLALLTGSAAPTSVVGPEWTAPDAIEVLAAQSAAGGQLATATQLAKATNGAARDVAITRKSLKSLKSKQAGLRSDYNSQLAELDKLSRQRASWSRDRQISKKKSASAALAKKLAAIDKKVRNASRSLTKRRRGLLRAVESELGGSVAGKRKTELQTLRNALAKRLRPKARKIVLPDASIDRLADPEELEEQAALIARAEAQLAKEDEKLEDRYRYYLKQEKLRAQSERATEFASRDDESIRRSPGVGTASERAGGGQSSEDSSPDASNDLGSPPFPEPEGTIRDFTLESSSVTLADVVDDVTAADLRRAGRSANPKARAKAAKKARTQLKAKLKRLRKQRRAIQKRAKELRSR